MKFLLPDKTEETPKGKRTVRENIWGNIVGYVGGRRWKEFGPIAPWTRREAEEWRAAGDPKGERK